MVKKRVVDYIKSQLQKGYAISTIKDVMLKYGYTSKDIDDAVNGVYHPAIRHEIHLSKSTIIAIVFIFASLIGIIVFFYYNPTKEPEQLLDLNLEPVKTEAEAGSDVVFIKELSNLGSSKRYDVVIKQEIIEPKTFKVITEKTETRAIETFGATQTKMPIPKDTKQGNYILRTIVEYDNKKAVATLPIKVIAKKEAEFVPVKELECNDNNQCTEDFIEKNEQSACIEDCAEELSPEEIPLTIEEIKETAKGNPSRALQQCNQLDVPELKDACIANIGEVQQNSAYCDKIESERIKDSCYSNVAKLTNDNSLCAEISTESRKDSCYMTFVLDNKDYSVCNKLNNSALRNSCESLRQLNELNKQAEQNQNT